MTPGAMDATPAASAPAMLSGMKVLAFVHYLQGPAATQYLADLGAEVIKVEPISGAFERKSMVAGLLPQDRSALFIAANRNQKSLAVDLKAPDGRELIARLIEHCDIVVENYRPGVMDKLGLGYEALKARKPDLIYASSSGYGPAGPLAGAANQDLLAQAESGLIAASSPRETPHAVGAAVTDQHGAALLAMGILAAYARRIASGRGARVEANLFSAAVDLQMEAITAALNQTAAPFDEMLARDARLANWYHPAPYGVYRTADASIALSLTTAEKLCAALEDPALEKIKRLDAFRQRDEYAALVGAALARRSYDDVAQRFKSHDIWFARVSSYSQLPSHVQAVHNASFGEVACGDATVKVVNHPLRFDGVVPMAHGALPRLGEHTREILERAGYRAQEIERLAGRGVVVLGDMRPDRTPAAPALRPSDHRTRTGDPS